MITDSHGSNLVDYLLSVSKFVSERTAIEEVNQIEFSCKDEEYDLDGDHIIPVEQGECEKELSQYEEVIKHHRHSTSLQIFVKASPLFIIVPFSTCH